MKRWTVAGCLLWIVGLIASIVGLNLSGSAGTWVSVVGNVLFLLGLAITGAVWFHRKRTEQPDEKP